MCRRRLRRPRRREICRFLGLCLWHVLLDGRRLWGRVGNGGGDAGIVLLGRRLRWCPSRWSLWVKGDVERWILTWSSSKLLYNAGRPAMKSPRCEYLQGTNSRLKGEF